MSKSNKNQLIQLHQMLQCFILKWMKYKNRLTFAYYGIAFWDFKSFQSVPKSWQVLKAKKNFFLKMSKHQNTVFYDFKSQFLVIFSSNYRHHLMLKIPFPDHIFSQNLKILYWKSSFPVNWQILCPLPSSYKVRCP